MAAKKTVTEVDPATAANLQAKVDECYADPLRFVLWAWPWGKPGTELENFSGPDVLQAQFLRDLGKHVKERKFDGRTPVTPIRMAISSGNGTGKTLTGAWIAWWILSTRPGSIGTVTSGTYDQLQEKAWAEIQHWGRMCITADQFDIQASGIFRKDPMMREKWKITPKTAGIGKEQSFAGQHAATSTSYFLFDEASEIPEGVWKVAPTCMTDGEPMFFAWGQMLRNTGPFYDACFGPPSKRIWDSRVFDARESSITNKETIAEWLQEYGEESDYYRVHVLGLAPRASEFQFIGQGLVDQARHCQRIPLPDEPLVWGYTGAEGFMSKHVFWPRRGLDAKTMPPIFLPGDMPREAVVSRAAELMSDQRADRRAAAMFGDQAFGAEILQRVRDSGYANVFTANLGAPSHDPRFTDQRAMLWNKMKEWLPLGAIPDDARTSDPLLAPGFSHQHGKLVVESKSDMKKRQVKALDGPDALALTFYQPVGTQQQMNVPQRRPWTPGSWMI